VGACISGPELLRQTLEVVNPEAVVTREDVARQVALEAVPVVALRLPLLLRKTQRGVTPPHFNLQTTAPGDGGGAPFGLQGVKSHLLNV